MSGKMILVTLAVILCLKGFADDDCYADNGKQFDHCKIEQH